MPSRLSLGVVNRWFLARDAALDVADRSSETCTVEVRRPDDAPVTLREEYIGSTAVRQAVRRARILRKQIRKGGLALPTR
jgi:hypothetical protein